jgi:thiol:disulfide interchange protein DsbA
MRFLKSIQFIAASVTFSLMALGGGNVAAAQGGKTVAYSVLTDPQPTDTGKKVEVIEFFGYGCPHCNAFDPALADWVKAQGDKIVFKRVPVGFHAEWVPHQKLFYTMEALGKTEEMHRKIFNAIHVDHQRLDNDDGITAFAVKSGIDKQKFLDAYNNFTVSTKVRRAAQLQQTYKIDQVPLIIIDGRYVTSPSKVGETMEPNQTEPALQAGTLKVMDELVAKAKKK